MLFSSCMSLLIFCLGIASLIKRQVVKTTVITVYLSIYIFRFAAYFYGVQFHCLVRTYLEGLFYSVGKSIIM